MDFHEFAEEYPLMSEYDLGRMIQGMTQHGYDESFPIVKFKGKILDGRNRWLAAQEANVKPTFTTFSGTEDEARIFVQTANEERRHLAGEWLKKRREERIARVAAAREEGQSIRTIAATEGVSPKTIQEDIKTATVEGYTVDPPDGKVESKDGRKRPASKPKILCDRCARMVNPVKDCQSCKDARAAAKKPKKTPKEAEEVVPMTDEEGHAIPDHCRSAFETLEKFRFLDSMCRALQSEIDEITKLPGGEQLARCTRPTGDEKKTINKSEHLNALKRDIKAVRPHSVCPYCEGKATKACKGCSGTGWVTATTWKDATDEVKARLTCSI